MEENSIVIDLNNADEIRRIDTLGSIATTEKYDIQFLEGLEFANSMNLTKTGKAFHELLIIATGGGSSISAALLRSYLIDEIGVPVILSQSYDVPGFVDEHTLVFVTSHSGNTEEVLSAYRQALKRGASMYAITSGGTLEQLCRKDGVPCLIVPQDIGHPRRDLGYIFVPMLVFLSKLGMIGDKADEIEELISTFSALKERYGPEVAIGDNIAKQAAINLYGHIPIIYGSLDFYDSVAWRIKNQFGENGKLMAFYNVIPNVHHDEAVGWDMPQDLMRKLYLLILRDDQLDSDKMKKRKDITREILKDRMGGVMELKAEGRGRLCRMFSLVYLGDFVTLYTPVYRGVDPTPVDIIDLFKGKMSE